MIVRVRVRGGGRVGLGVGSRFRLDAVSGEGLDLGIGFVRVGAWIGLVWLRAGVRARAGARLGVESGLGLGLGLGLG